MNLTAERIPDGSHLLRGWHSGDHGDDIDVVGTLLHISDTVCELAAVKGDLSNDMNVMIGFKAWSLGYKTIRWHRTIGGVSSRWARQVGTDGAFDYYEVDLGEAITAYTLRGAV